jgi:hypothetical protein
MEDLGQKYEFAFCQRFLQGLEYPVALHKITSLKLLNFSNFVRSGTGESIWVVIAFPSSKLSLKSLL